MGGLRAARAFVLLALPLGLLGGCSALDVLGGTTARVYDLEPGAVPDGLPAVAGTLLVDQPFAPGNYDSNRLVVIREGGSIQLMPEMRWVERIPRMLQNDLVRAIEATGVAPVLTRQAASVRGDYLLETEIRRFGAVVDGAPSIELRLTARVIDRSGPDILAQKVFSRTAPAAGTAADDQIDAYRTAYGSLVADIAAWSIREMAAAETS